MVRARKCTTSLFPLKKGISTSAVLPAFFGEDLDADVVVFVRGKPVVVPVDLTIENDGRRAGSQRFARHLQFFRRNRLKALARANCDGTKIRQRPEQDMRHSMQLKLRDEVAHRTPERLRSTERAPRTFGEGHNIAVGLWRQ